MIRKIYKAFCKFEEVLAMLLLGGLAALVFISALMRTLKHPLNWAQDVALVAFAWLIFFGSDIAVRGSGLIGIDMLVKRFPKKVQKALDIMQRVYGEQSLQVAICYQNMGANFGYAKQYEKSLEYYRKSHDIFLSFLGPDHPNMGGVYLGMGSMYNELGNYLEAKKYILKSVEILRKTYGDDYPYRKEIEEGLVDLEEKMAKQAEK